MDRRSLTRLTVIVVLLLLALFALPPLMSAYYTVTMTQVAMYSLGQLAVLTIGAWVGARLLFATSQPYILVLIEAGLVTMIIGSLITLPALRLRGLYLALITLMLAGGVSVILATLNFPNGGGGFSGYNGSQLHTPQIRRPSFAGTDPAFYRFSVIVAIVMFLLVLAHLRARPGRAWAALRQSEPSALAAGINTTFYKLWAMALAAFVTGVAGALLAGADRQLFSINFPIQNSINLLAVVLMGGVFSLTGAVIAAFLQAFLPALLQNWGVPNDWLIILFGVGVMQVLTTAPGGIADQFPKDMKRLYGLISRLWTRPPAVAAGSASTASAAGSAGKRGGAA
jgi:branched-chain amino acid transport system permease protein